MGEANDIATPPNNVEGNQKESQRSSKSVWVFVFVILMGHTFYSLCLAPDHDRGNKYNSVSDTDISNLERKK